MIDIVGVQVDLGASKKGVNMGPAWMRFEGLAEDLAAAGIALEDEGDLVPVPGGKTSSNMHFYEAINDLNARLFRVVSDAHRRGMFPLVLGGDHSLAAGSVAATSTHFGNIGVIWVDAHADFNDDKSTVSGNIHGMPLSAVCGQGPDSMLAFGVPVSLVDPKHVVIVGGRDIEPQEWVKMNDCGVSVFGMDEIHEKGIDSVIKEAIAIASEGTEGIHVSFDIDAMDPREAPGVGTPVPGGFTQAEAYKIIYALKECKKVLAMDMVEINPVLDIQGMTAKLANKLVTEFLK